MCVRCPMHRCSDMHPTLHGNYAWHEDVSCQATVVDKALREAILTGKTTRAMKMLGKFAFTPSVLLAHLSEALPYGLPLVQALLRANTPEDWATRTKYHLSAEEFWRLLFQKGQGRAAEALPYIMLHLPTEVLDKGEDMLQSMRFGSTSRLRFATCDLAPALGVMKRAAGRWGPFEESYHAFRILLEYMLSVGRASMVAEMIAGGFTDQASRRECIASAQKAVKGRIGVGSVARRDRERGTFPVSPVAALAVLGSVRELELEQVLPQLPYALQAACSMEMYTLPTDLLLQRAILKGGLHHCPPLQRLATALPGVLQRSDAAEHRQLLRYLLVQRAQGQVNWERRERMLRFRARSRSSPCGSAPAQGPPRAPLAAPAFRTLLRANPPPAELRSNAFLAACFAQEGFSEALGWCCPPFEAGFLAHRSASLLRVTLRAGNAATSAAIVDAAQAHSTACSKLLGKALLPMLTASLLRGSLTMLAATVNCRGRSFLRQLLQPLQWRCLLRAAASRPNAGAVCHKTHASALSRLHAVRTLQAKLWQRHEFDRQGLTDCHMGDAMSAAAATGHVALFEAVCRDGCQALQAYLNLVGRPSDACREPATLLQWAERGGHQDVVAVLTQWQVDQAARQAAAGGGAAEEGGEAPHK